MFRPRVIPVLLLKDRALVKSIKFKDHKYIGDPLNATRIFNERKADELIILDIEASADGRTIPLDLVKNVGEEARMPFAVGGGIRSLEDIEAIIKAGAEKVVINSQAGMRPEFVRSASETFGSTSIVVCMDVESKFLQGERVRVPSGANPACYTPESYAQLMEDNGAGELIVQCIERDGTMRGYDVKLIRSVSKAVGIPIVALGGAGSLNDLIEAYRIGHASALAAGSLFVYQCKRRGVLINYPEKADLRF
jgi:cyclase